MTDRQPTRTPGHTPQSANGTTTPPDIARLSGRVRATWVSLLFERAWPAFVPLLSVIGAFLAVSFFGVWDRMPGLAHAAGLAAFALAAIVAIWRGLSWFRMPSWAEAVRRVEEGSRLAHRPIATLQDRAAADENTNPLSAALWRRHVDQARAQTRAARTIAPQPDTPPRDPLALRIAVAIAAVAGLAYAGADAPMKLYAAVSPQLQPAVADRPVIVDAWATPPEYTGVAPIFLTAEAPAPAAEPRARERAGDPTISEIPPRIVEVPEGSVLTVRIDGLTNAPVARAGDDRTLPGFEQVAETGVFQADITLEDDGTIAVARTAESADLAGWVFAIRPDDAPRVSFAEPISVTNKLAIKIDYDGRDDYGIESIDAVIRLAPAHDTADEQRPAATPKPESANVDDDRDRILNPTDEDIVWPLPLRSMSPTVVVGDAFRDLTPHPYAGLPVRITLRGRDAAGQIGLSETVEMVLPERAFTHPVAKALIEQRKVLSRAPERQPLVAKALAAILVYPEGLFENYTPYLAISTASHRLSEADDPETRASVQELLWHTALALEDGQLSLALSELRALQDQLRQALADDASDERIRELMDQLRAAMDRYLQEMARRALENPTDQQLSQNQIDPNQAINRDQLQQMLDAIEQMAQSGARESAEQLLSQLQNMLENLQAGAPQQMTQGQSAMNDALSALSDLMTQQQRLMDRTMRDAQGNQQGQQGQQGQQQGQRGNQPGQQGQQGQQGQGGQQFGQGQQGQQGQGRRGEQGRVGGQQGQQGQGTQGLAQGQGELSNQLGALMDQLGQMTQNMPGALGRAQDSMRDAQGALQNDNSAGALPSQRDALDQLRDGAQSLAREMLEQMQSQAQDGQGETGTQGQNNAGNRQVDPLGRPGGNRVSEDGVRVPDERALQTVREILEELRSRANRLDRPADELDYLRRLLERF